MQEMINWRRGNPETPPAKLCGMLQGYYVRSAPYGKRLKVMPQPGNKVVSARNGDMVDYYSLPEGIPMVIVKCALRWYYQSSGVYGKDGEYVVR